MNSSPTKTREIRKFGIVALVLFGTIACIGLWRQRMPVIYCFGTLSIVGFLFLLLPRPLRPAYEGWIKASHFIGLLSTFVILTIAYYTVLTPTALLKRMFGGRPLPMGPDKSLSSYWVSRSEFGQPRERFSKRY